MGILLRSIQRDRLVRRLAQRQPRAGRLAPDPATTPEAVVQVYGARTWGWKGIFGVHTWVAVKPTDARSWTVL